MFKRILTGSMLVALLAYAPMQLYDPAQVHAKQPLALMVHCQGDVVVVRSDGSSVKGAFGLSLSPGDEVRTGKGGEADIMFDNGNVIHIGAGSQMQMQGPKSYKSTPPEQVAMGEGSFETVQSFLKLKDSEGTSSIARLRSADKKTEIKAESPSNTRVRDGRPTFRWSVTEPAGELRVTVYNEEGVHWQHDAAGETSVAYPGDAPPLVAGVSYSWTVETTDPLQFPPQRSATAFFEVLPVEEAKTLTAALERIAKQEKPSKSTNHLVRASLFYKHGLMEDAIEETLQALENDADNPALQSILARLFAEVGRTDEALKTYDRLLEKR